MRRVLAVLLLAGCTLVGTATPAFAHNVLISSDPADGASLATGPQQVTLTFDQPVQGGFNTVTVVGPDNTHWEAGAPSVRNNVVTTPVRPLGPAGEYTVGYRILSADGHPVYSSVKFTLTTAGTGTPAPPSETNPGPGTTAGGSSPGGEGGMPVWPWILGAVVLLGGGLALALRSGAAGGGPAAGGGAGRRSSGASQDSGRGQVGDTDQDAAADQDGGRQDDTQR